MISQISVNMEKKIYAEKMVLKEYMNLKQALMSDLLTGKVRVKYEEEAAEAT